MSCESGLAASCSPRAAASAPDVGLGRVAQREDRVPQALRGQHREHVGLVLAGVDGAVQRRRPRGGIDVEAGVVAGADGVEAEREGLVEQRRELDPLVAAHARVRRAAGRVLGDEVVDDVALEALGEVPHVEGDAEHVGRSPGVPGVLDRAAAAGSGPQGGGVAGQREVDADDVVPGVDGTRGGDGRVDPTAHRGEHPHGVPTRSGTVAPLARPARRARSTAGPIAAATAATSAGVDGQPSENRRAPRAASGLDAHRQQHVAGLGHAGLAGRAGRALDTARVEQVEQRVALAAGEREVRVARAAGPRGRGRRAGRRPGRRRAPRRRAASTQGRQPRARPRLLLRGQVGGDGERPHRRRVERAGPDAALLPAAVQDRHEVEPAPGHQRADADRPADLVPAQRQAVDRCRGEVEPAAGRPPGRRRCAPGSPCSVGDLGDLLDRLDRADLVVRPHRP